MIAESLGKNKKGIIPVISKVRDHHSLLSFYLDGQKINFYIFSERNKKTKLKKVYFQIY